MTTRSSRSTNHVELARVIDYWISPQRGAGYHDAEALAQYLLQFTPDQIVRAMYIATETPSRDYFGRLSSILSSWSADLEAGRELPSFEVPGL